MQSRSKSPIVNQRVVIRLYTTTLHNNITVQGLSGSQADPGFSPIHVLWPFRVQGSNKLFQAHPVSA